MSALQKALHLAVVTLPKTADGTDLQPATPSATRAMIDKHLHTAIAATTGAVGGFFGLAGIGLEIPATTTGVDAVLHRPHCRHAAARTLAIR